jgi:hypothetical protein
MLDRAIFTLTFTAALRPGEFILLQSIAGNPPMLTYCSRIDLARRSEIGPTRYCRRVRSPVVMSTSAGMPGMRRSWTSAGIVAVSTEDHGLRWRSKS